MPLGFAPSPIGPSWPHPRGRPRLFLAYISDRWGPVIKLTCQILLTHRVVDFCTFGFAPSPIRPRWPHPMGRPRWFSAYSPDPWRPVFKLTCQIFLTHPVADFCTLVFALPPIGRRWPPLRVWPKWFSAYSPDS